MKNKMKHILAAAAIAAGALGVGAGPVEAGGSCLPPTYSRSGDYVTYSAYATGQGGHRVQVIWNGVWYSGPIVYGDGWSRKTLRHPNYNGIALCMVVS